MDPEPPRLSRSALGWYALPGAGVGFMENLIQFLLLKFAAEVLLLAPGWMGLLLGLSRVWDAFSTPLAGYASDRTRTRLGRRRPWILAAGAPLAVAFVALWSPPRSLSGAALIGWMGAALWLFVTAQAAFHVPHLALGAELTRDEQQRNRVFALRMALSLSGVFAAALVLGALERSPQPRRAAALVAASAGAATLLGCTLAAWRLREPEGHRELRVSSPLRAFAGVLRNPHARLLLAVLFFEAIGFATMVTSMAFATEYLFEREGATSILLAGALLSMLASVPLWLRLAHRHGRRRLWLFSLVGRALAFGSLLLLPATAWQVLVAAVVVIGSLFGCGQVFGPAVKADVVDDDARRSGERREGTFFASWNLAQKTAEGGAIALAGAVLELSHFEPNAVQDAGALLGIRTLFAGLPCLFYATAALLLARLPPPAGEPPRAARARRAIVANRSRPAQFCLHQTRLELAHEAACATHGLMPRPAALQSASSWTAVPYSNVIVELSPLQFARPGVVLTLGLPPVRIQPGTPAGGPEPESVLTWPRFVS